MSSFLSHVRTGSLFPCCLSSWEVGQFRTHTHKHKPDVEIIHLVSGTLSCYLDLVLHLCPWRTHCLPVNVHGALINSETSASLSYLFLNQNPVVRFSFYKLCNNMELFPLMPTTQKAAFFHIQVWKIQYCTCVSNLHFILTFSQALFACTATRLTPHKTLTCDCVMLVLCCTGSFRGPDPSTPLASCLALWPLHLNSDVTIHLLQVLINVKHNK